MRSRTAFNLPRITFQERKLTLNPDPIIVRQGENIEIELFADLTNSGYSIGDFLKYKNLKWKLHFKNGNPFHSEPYTTIEFKTFIREGVPMHSDIVSIGIANIKGDYKFDIALMKDSDPYNYISSNNYVGEDLIEEVDPIIIVI